MKKLILIILLLLMIFTFCGCDNMGDIYGYSTTDLHVHIYETGKCYKIKNFKSGDDGVYRFIIDDENETRVVMYINQFALILNGNCPFCEEVEK